MLSPGLITILFVFIYGSGFAGAKLGLPSAEPFTFLSIRFFFSCFILTVIAMLLGRRFKQEGVAWSMLSGFLLQGVFSVGVFYALYLGMKPAVSAMIISLQPLLVTVLAEYYLKETVSKRVWVGLFVGVFGVSLVVFDSLTTKGIGLYSVLFALLGLVGLCLGQIIHKKHCAQVDLFVGGAVQAFTACVCVSLLALLFESRQINWNVSFVLAELWMIVGVSVGALSLLYILIREKSSSGVASVFYGVPVSAGLIAWPLFGDVPSGTDWVGFLIVLMAIALVYGDKSNN
jgi:drug/metabolite transporter (DMT)-like permease